MEAYYIDLNSNNSLMVYEPKASLYTTHTTTINFCFHGFALIYKISAKIP